MKLIKLEKNYKKFLNRKKKEKYIVFVDSCLDHKDVVKYQGNLKEDKREKYTKQRPTSQRKIFKFRKSRCYV